MKNVMKYRCAFTADLAKRLCSLGVITALATLSASNASATVVGSLLTGSSGTVTVTLNSVTFSNDPSATGGGNSNVSNGTLLNFAGCVGALGSAGCLSATEGITVLSPFSAASIPSNTFLTFAAHPNLVFSVTGAGPGSANTNCLFLAISEACSVFAGSPIILQLASAVSTGASLSVTGRASDTGIGGLPTGSIYNGGFNQTVTAAIAGADPGFTTPTPANIQRYFCGSDYFCDGAEIAAASRSITSSQSGSFFATAEIPEPSVLSMVGGALVLLGIGRGRLRRRS